MISGFVRLIFVRAIATLRQSAPNCRSLCSPQLFAIHLINSRSNMTKPIVRVKDGQLQGATVQGVLGCPYLAFYEIPFAAPPVGELRFKDPQPPSPWTGIKDVSQILDRRAPQRNEFPPKDIIGSEDCLYLNVYTPAVTGRKPVMFWVHGGSYVIGTASANVKKPDYLMKKDVVIVAANYRLGALGFLNLGHRAAPGNFGLKDLILALEWVKGNISHFGGDPDNVTIFGISAGGALCHALALSPRAKGLFHKAILQSGTVTCPWARVKKPERNFDLAKNLGKNSTDPEEVVRFLRTVSVEDLITEQEKIVTKEGAADTAFFLSLVRDDMAENPVLPLPWHEQLTKDISIPFIVGNTSHEYIMFLRDKSQETIDGLTAFLPEAAKALQAVRNAEALDTEELVKAVKNQYWGGGPITVENIEGVVRFYSDVYFGLPARYLVEDRVKRNCADTFYYVYSYVGNEKAHTDILGPRQLRGAAHVDENSYLFYIPLYKSDNPDPPAEGTKDRLMIERMTTLWTNFAKTGNPTPITDNVIKTTWRPATTDNLRYLSIDDELEMSATVPDVLSSQTTAASCKR